LLAVLLTKLRVEEALVAEADAYTGWAGAVVGFA
jgi:hypothetical protein